jgi:hypothetical protein
MSGKSSNPQVSALRQAILALADRPQGVTNRELQDALGVTSNQADSNPVDIRNAFVAASQRGDSLARQGFCRPRRDDVIQPAARIASGGLA